MQVPLVSVGRDGSPTGIHRSGQIPTQHDQSGVALRSFLAPLYPGVGGSPLKSDAITLLSEPQSTDTIQADMTARPTIPVVVR
jgi:hypothetical protein